MSRWFNLATIVSSTENDLWIHRENDELWWTVSRAGEPEVVHEAGSHTAESGLKVFVLHKPAEPWSNTTREGARLD